MIQQFHPWVYIWRISYFEKIHALPIFTAALFIIAKTWTQPICLSTDEWIKNMWYRETVEYYSTTKNKEIMPFAATWMDLEIAILSEVNQTEKDKYHMILLIYGI